MKFRNLKGFAIRRPGRPRGSRAIDRNQADLFSVEKLLSQCGWQNFRSPEREAAAQPPTPPAIEKRLYVPVTRKVSAKFGTKGDLGEGA